MVFFQGRKAMSPNIRCAHCKSLFELDPRSKNQDYCGRKDCQRARKRAWQKEKMKTDPDYRANQRDCQKNWRQRHPGYYREYRSRNRLSAERNRLLQRVRDARRRPRLLAKMDALQLAPAKDLGPYYLLPVLAKMDASTLKVVLIPVCWRNKTCLQKRTR